MAYSLKKFISSIVKIIYNERELIEYRPMMFALNKGLDRVQLDTRQATRGAKSRIDDI